MNVPEDCEYPEPDSNDSEGQQIASRKEGVSSCLLIASPENKSSEFQKAKYFWVLSRF